MSQLSTLGHFATSLYFMKTPEIITEIKALLNSLPHDQTVRLIKQKVSDLEIENLRVQEENLKTIADMKTRHSDLVNQIHISHGNIEFEIEERHKKVVAEKDAIIAKFSQPIPPESAIYSGRR